MARVAGNADKGRRGKRELTCFGPVRIEGSGLFNTAELGPKVDPLTGESEQWHVRSDKTGEYYTGVSFHPSERFACRFGSAEAARATAVCFPHSYIERANG